VLLPESERERIFAFWRAPTNDGCTLITTRDSRPATGISSEKLDVLSEEDALRLLARFREIRTDEIQVAKDLIFEVGAHTQALVLLGERLREDTASYTHTLEQLREKGRLARIEETARVLATELGDKARGIVATFEISITQQPAAAQVLLRLTAECAPSEPIPITLLEKALGAANAGDTFNRALSNLLRASLLTRRRGQSEGGGPIEIHPLLADVTRLLVTPIGYNPRDQLGQALLQGLKNVGDFKRRDELAPIIVHASYLTMEEANEQTVEIAAAMSLYQLTRRDFLLARLVSEHAFNMSVRVFGEDHPWTTIVRSNLATSHSELGNLEIARSLQEQNLDARTRTLAPEHPARLMAMDNLGVTLRAQREFEAARALQEQAVAAYRKRGENHPDTLIAKGNLALTLSEMGNLLDAESLQREVLAAHLNQLGENDPITLTSMTNLAATLERLDQLPEARELRERALLLRRGLLGEENTTTLSAAYALLNLLIKMSDFAASKRLLTDTALGRLPEISNGRLTKFLISLKPKIIQLRRQLDL
jgi:tetratricopeptide (TPR) repeat protein